MARAGVLFPLAFAVACVTGVGCGDSQPELADVAPAGVARDSEPSAVDLTGNWTVVGHRMPGVSAMGDAEASGWHGRKLRLTGSEALTSGGRCGDPAYRGRRVSLDSLAASFGVRPANLDFTGSPADVAILEVSCGDQPWAAMGHLLIESDGERAFAPWDGVFFELERDRAADAVDFRARGNEPFWSLEITEGEQIRLSRPVGDAPTVTTPVPEPRTDPSSGAVTYEAVTEAADLRVVIEPVRCSDSMSGFDFETTVTVTLNGEVLRGCGGPMP